MLFKILFHDGRFNTSLQSAPPEEDYRLGQLGSGK